MLVTRFRAPVGRCAEATAIKHLSLVLLAIALLSPVQNVGAATQYTMGTIRVGNTLAYGTTSFSIDYIYPAQAQVGSSLPINFTLHVSSLTGLVEYITHYQMIVYVALGTRVLNASVSGGNNTALPVPKYPGSVWGPKTASIPLTPDNTGIAPGQTVNATVTLELEDLIWYGAPLSLYDTEPPMQGGAGSLLIQNGPASSTSSGSGGGQASARAQNYLPYLLLASGLVLMVSAAFLPRRRGPS